MNPELRKRIELAAKHGFHVTKDDGTAVLEYIDTLQKQLAEAQQREARLTATNQQQRDEMGRTIEHLQAKWVEAERAREEAQRQVGDAFRYGEERMAELSQENARLRAALENLPRYMVHEVAYRKDSGHWVQWRDLAAALRGEKKYDNPST